MNVLLISQCTKKALTETRRILDQFAERRDDRTWQTSITDKELATLRNLLRKTARKNTAVACHWIRGKDDSALVVAPLTLNCRASPTVLFEKFHRTLAVHGVGGIGVSFPDAREGARSLGHRLRLHATAGELKRFLTTSWLVGMQDYLLADAVTPVPTSAKHRVVCRVQAKSNPERLRRRLIARKGVTSEDAMQIIPDTAAERLNLPYVILTSRSSGHRFRLFIRHQPIQEVPIGGLFSGYGLGKESTVPWF